MKVLLNLGPLGGQVKTGVYRVSEHLMKGLAAKLGEAVTFHPFLASPESCAYYSRNLKPAGAGLAVTRLGRILLPLSEKLNAFIRQSFEDKSIHLRIVRKIAGGINKRFEKIISKVSTRTLRDYQIYHSPFHQIPNWVKEGNPNIRRFITIYDLIAITHPEYFKEDTVTQIHGIIDSLNQEDYTLCISSATRDVLLANSNCSPERSFVIPLAASDHFFPVKADDKSNKAILDKYGICGPGYILSVCTLEIRKNLETIIIAFGKLRHAMLLPEETKLVLVGGGGWKTENINAALASASAFRDQIIVTGFIPDEDLSIVYSAAKVFVYMSFIEGFGLPPLEAMQCGTPVITSDTSSLPEVVGDAGITLSPTDVTGLCAAIAKIYGDEEYRSQLSSKSLKRAKLFSWERFVDDTIKVYRSALAS